MNCKIVMLFFSGVIAFSSCSKKMGSVRGYAYPGESLRISVKGEMILDTKLGGRQQGNGLCYIERFFYLPGKDRENVLRVEIDSNNWVLLDTTITLRRSNKDPYLFLYSPMETFWKRRLIAGDGSTEIKL
jgi:hypothetical protein